MTKCVTLRMIVCGFVVTVVGSCSVRVAKYVTLWRIVLNKNILEFKFVSLGVDSLIKEVTGNVKVRVTVSVSVITLVKDRLDVSTIV